MTTSTLRERLSLPVVLVLSSLGAFGAGIAWMTHMHHRALRYVEPSEMTAFDTGYESLTSVTVIPVGVVGVACTVALLFLRPRGIPVWMIGLSLVLQLFVFVARISMWGTWAEDVRAAGSIRLADGSFHPSYTQYMDTNWIRIAVITAYALLGLAMAVVAVTRRPPSGVVAS